MLPFHSQILLILALFGCLLLQPATADALDPRFEIDSSLFRSPSVTATTRNKERRVAQVRKPRRIASSLRSSGVNKQEPASRLYLAPSGGVFSEQEVGRIRSFWSALTATDQSLPVPLMYRTPAFSLAIDPQRYPILIAGDGGKVLLDPALSLPPLVRNLLQEHDPDLHIVSVSPRDSRRFLRELLQVGGFYSVEEQPHLSFGTNPQLQVQCDFKVERTAASVMQQEVTLVSTAAHAAPASLKDYLKAQGFLLTEPFAAQSAEPLPPRHRIVPVTVRDQQTIVDMLLGTLAIPVTKQQQVELYSPLESGVALSILAERTFEYAGKRYVVARFTGDPVLYTLTRLLETRGYRVVMLHPGDTFRIVADKLLSRISFPARYAVNPLVSDPAGRYALTASGVLLENVKPAGGSVLLTDTVPEQGLHRLLSDYGYQVQESRR